MEKYDLKRFIAAQAKGYDGYEMALREIRAGKKVRHWIWYVFPQLKALGHSDQAVYYGIADLSEAQAYMKEETLRANLLEICGALLIHNTNDPLEIMTYPVDVKKLRSSMTLFAEAAPEYEVFQKVLDKFFEGRKDRRTLALLGKLD